METWARDRTKFIVEPIAKGMAKLGISANTITLLSLLLNILAAGVIANDQPLWGGLLMGLIAMPLDAIDGTVARLLNQQNAFGAFFDSVLDRFSEGAILIGITILLIHRQEYPSVPICLLALLGSQMVSYTRARAEGLKIECKVGWFPRLPRVIVMAVGLIVDQLPVALSVLAIASLLTSLQRIIHVYRVTHPLEDSSKMGVS